MKTRFLTVALSCIIGFGGAHVAFAQAPKTGKGAEKKAPAPKSPADLALDAFNKVRSEGGNKDQARFQKVIAAGMSYLMEYPTHGGVSGAVNNLAFYANSFDKKQAAMKTSYLSLLKLDVTNAKYKEGISDAVKAALGAVEAAIADVEVRDQMNRDNVAALREKIDALVEIPGGSRFLAERERSYTHILALGVSPARAEEHARKLLEHKEKAVKDMAREELNIFETKKEPYALKFTALDGKPVDFAQLRGKVVAMYFWNSTSKTSTDRLEPLKQLHSTYRKRGFEVVTVAMDKEEDRDKLAKFVKDNRVAFPVYFDGKGTKSEFSQKLSITGTPRLLVFDQKGMLQTSIQGSPVARLTPDLPQKDLEPTIKKLLAIK